MWKVSDPILLMISHGVGFVVFTQSWSTTEKFSLFYFAWLRNGKQSTSPQSIGIHCVYMNTWYTIFQYVCIILLSIQFYLHHFINVIGLDFLFPFILNFSARVLEKYKKAKFMSFSLKIWRCTVQRVQSGKLFTVMGYFSFQLFTIE